MSAPLEHASQEYPGKAVSSLLLKADWTLRLAILLFAVGLARALFTRVGTSFGNLALMEWDVAHADILFAEKLAATLILAAAVSIVIRPTVVALLLIAAPIFAEACAGVRAGGFPFYELTPYANAMRYLTPLALIPLLFRSRPGAVTLSAWVLRLGLATIFLIHGYEAWQLHPQFIDYIIGSGRKLGEIEISESTASRLLRWIAVLDLVAAVMVLVSCSRWLLAWLCIWGLVTALSRPLSAGFQAYPEVLLRASHFLGPVALWWLILARKQWKTTAAKHFRRKSDPPAAYGKIALFSRIRP